MGSTFGPTYDSKFDRKRILRQMDRVKELMLSALRLNSWLTLTELHVLTGYPEASISAQLRHLRKTEFGAYVVNKRVRGDRDKGLWEYQLESPKPAEQKGLFQ